MRTNIIVRLVCWSVVAALLVTVLALGLTLGTGFGWGLQFSGVHMNDGFFFEGETATGPVQLDASQIRRIKVDWPNGKVEILPHDAGTIGFEQTASVDIPDKYRLRYELSQDGTLRIRMGKPQRFWGVFIMSSTLALRLPEAWGAYLSVDSASAGISIEGLALEELHLGTASGRVDAKGVSAPVFHVETTSGAIRLSQITSDDLNLEGTSGAIRGEGVTARQATLETVSGAIRVAGAFEALDCETVSGELKVESATAPSQADLDSVSGRVALRIPENAGFTARIETVSGRTSVDFPVTVRGGSSIYGDGGAAYSLETVSGGIAIERVPG